jgi:hypothetical protein
VSRVIPFPALAAIPDECCSESFPISLHEAVAATRRSHRALIAAAGEWALARGLPLPADHVALWAAAAGYRGQPVDTDGVSGPWRASHLADFVTKVAEWCAIADCPLPAGLPESLWHLYGFLADTGRLHPASDHLTELRAALVVFGRSDRFLPLSPPPEPTAA